MWINLEYIYLKYEKIKPISFIFYLIISYGIYRITLSRTILIASIIFFILLFYEKYLNKKQLLVKISRFILPILSIIIISASFFYEKFPNVEKLDDLLSRRVSLGKVAMDLYGITIIPQKVNYKYIVKWKDEYTMKLVLDSIYTRSAVSYGLLFLGLLIYGFYKKNREITNKEAIFIIMFAITGITENYILNAYICFPLLFLGRTFYSTQQKEGKEYE